MFRKTLVIAALLLGSIATGGPIASAGPRATAERSARPAERARRTGATTRTARARTQRARTTEERNRLGRSRTRTRTRATMRQEERVNRGRIATRDTRQERTRRQERIRPLDTRVQQRKVLSEPLEKAPFKADYVDIGMGPTGMMTMLSAIATGHTAVGVELRGAPVRGVHQNIRVDWYHTLARIDDLMLKRYGPDGIPKLPNGKPFILHDFFYNPQRVGGRLDFPEIYGKGDEQNQNVAGRLDRISFEDARESTVKGNGGKAKMYVLPSPPLPERADPKKLNPDMKAVLDSPSTFQAALINYELMLRTYIKAMERQDRAAGREPRVKVYENYRVAQEDGVAAGYINARGGKKRIVIEAVTDHRTPDGKANRIRKPGSKRIDLGTPTRFSLTAGFGGGADAKTLGYTQEDVVYNDPASGKSVAARQQWLVGEVTANIGGQLIRRISTARDPKTGRTETVRQLAVGHEYAPNVAWVPVQVPDFMTFDPIEAGKVPAGTDPKSERYTKAQQKLIRDFYIKQVSEVLHLKQADIRKMRMFYGPSYFTLKERLGTSARLARNGNVAGDLMGNGHFLTSGGSMTGMIGHANRYIDYWEALNHGMPEGKAARRLLKGIKTDSEAWLHTSIKEFFDVSPVNFGAERAAAIQIGNEATGASAGNGVDYGLGQVLGQASWANSFERLRRGEFGEAGKDFYVPDKELDVTAAPNVTVERLGETKDGAGARSRSRSSSSRSRKRGRSR